MSYPPREGSRDIADGLIISNYPDYCRSPKDVIPYNIYAYQSDDANTATSVRFTGKKAHTTGSIETCCYGDEAGVGLGIDSGTHLSICEAKTFSKTVRIEGKHALRHGDTCYMNNRNTTGKICYVKDVNTYQPTLPYQNPPRKEESDNTANTAQPDSRFLSDEAQQALASGKQVMTDAMPESPIANADYAQALKSSAPAPESPSSSPPWQRTPSSRGRNAANSNIEQWKKNAPRRPSRWWQLTKWIKRGTAVSVFLETMFYSSPAGLFSDRYAEDATEKALLSEAKEMYYDGVNISEIYKWYDEAVIQHRMQQQISSLNPPQESITPENTRVTGTDKAEDQNDNKKCPCLVGPYAQIQPICKTQCGPTAQAHHIIADKTFRLGTRKGNGPRIPTSGDFKPFPTLDSGAAICLDGAASVKGTLHNIAHRADTWVTNLGKQSDIPGLAKVSDITDLYVESAIYARPDCASQIIDEVNKSMNGTDPNALGRTTRNPPKPGSPAHNAIGIGK